MGTVAARLSDAVVLTSDNPRSEDPLQIIEEIKRGLVPPDRPLGAPRPAGRAGEVGAVVGHRRSARGHRARPSATRSRATSCSSPARGTRRRRPSATATLPFDDVGRGARGAARAPSRPGGGGHGVTVAAMPSTARVRRRRRRARDLRGDADARVPRVSRRLAHAARRATRSSPSRARAATGTTSSATALDAGRERARRRATAGAAADAAAARRAGGRSWTTPSRALQAHGARRPARVRRAGGGHHRQRRQDDDEGSHRDAAVGARTARCATAGNLNNHIGLPLSLLDLQAGRRGGGRRTRDEPRRRDSRRWWRSPSPTCACGPTSAPRTSSTSARRTTIAEAKAEILEARDGRDRGRGQRRRPAA